MARTDYRMIVDSSAWLAILLNEPERESFTRAIAHANTVLVSSATWLETHIVLHHVLGLSGVRAFRLMLKEALAKIVPLDEEQAEIAYIAYQQYGKGQHPAALNYGDCMSYALAKSRSMPLLYKGNDFAQTDVEILPGVNPRSSAGS